MDVEPPLKLVERLLAFRDSGNHSGEGRDLLADACAMISRQTNALEHLSGCILTWKADRECKLLPTEESLVRAEVEIEVGLCKKRRAS